MVRKIEILSYLLFIIATPLVIADKSQMNTSSIEEVLQLQEQKECQCYEIHEVDKPKLLYPLKTCDELTASSIDNETHYLTKVEKIKCN